MKTLAVVLSLFSLAAFAQPTPPGCGVNRSCRVFDLYTSSASVGIVLGAGSRLCFDGSTTCDAANVSLRYTTPNFLLSVAGSDRLSWSHGTGNVVITAPSATLTGALTITNGMTLTGSGININTIGGYLNFNQTTVGGIISGSISAANAGTTPATAAFRIYPDTVLGLNDYVFHVGSAANAATLFRVDYEGDIATPGTASIGTGTGLILLDGTAGIGEGNFPGGTRNGNTTFSAYLRSLTLDATVSPTVPAIIAQVTTALTPGDAVFGVQDSVGTNLCRVTVDGNLLCNGVITSGSNAAIFQTSETRDVPLIASTACAADMLISTIGSATFEAGDACHVGFALSTTGGLASTVWSCWPSLSNQIALRVCCINGAAGTCDPASQTIYYTVTCADGNCN